MPCSTGPASWCSAAPSRPVGRRPGDRGVQRADRRAEGARRGRRRPLRQAGRQRPGLGRAGQARASRDPEAFADYYANDVLALVCAAWLGPGYQVTSQVNVVNPGGRRQVAHRDYHLGFMSHDQSPRLPGARAPPVAGADPAGRGRPLRHAGRDRPDDVPAALAEVRPGYLAFRPARVHRVLRRPPRPAAAGQGRRGVLQPRPVPRRRHQPLRRRPPDGQPAAGVLRVRPGDGDASTGPRCARRSTRRCARRKAGGAAEQELRNVVAASAEGYAFPTNLDLDQPVGGLAPQTQAELVWRALEEGWDTATFAAGLRAHTDRRGA